MNFMKSVILGVLLSSNVAFAESDQGSVSSPDCSGRNNPSAYTVTPSERGFEDFTVKVRAASNQCPPTLEVKLINSRDPFNVSSTVAYIDDSGIADSYTTKLSDDTRRYVFQLNDAAFASLKEGNPVRVMVSSGFGYDLKFVNVLIRSN
ncbi:MAG: hypothetical protein CL677_07725 [Bdellovibrionaceae bacterium]|nr:hypothetical protein [Pseudobdellovibrionaceae bacterium]|tara:strand:- start:28611 stop:29057 length:447 start_codon:yes stop_codon:yes gene_type:complete